MITTGMEACRYIPTVSNRIIPGSAGSFPAGALLCIKNDQIGGV
jgi:hypothetical protein